MRPRRRINTLAQGVAESGSRRGAGGIALAAALTLSACQGMPGMQNDQQTGGLLGGAAGAIAGGLLGNSFGGSGALIAGVNCRWIS